MRENGSVSQLATSALSIAALTPLAVYCGSAWGWTPGATGLAFLLLPTCAAALTGHRLGALSVGGAAAFGCFVEATATGQLQGAGFEPAFPAFAAVMVLSCTGIMATVAERLRGQVRRLEEQNTQYVRDLYRRDREAAKDDSVPTPSKNDVDDQKHADDSDINYPMLLLTLQDIGRRVSTNLDPDTLIPTILSTAKASLKCAQCHVFLWDAREQTLKNPLPSRQRDRMEYVPRPQHGMAAWVLKHRQILTRRSVEDDYAMRRLLEEDPHLPDAIAPLTVGGELLGLLIVDQVDEDSQNFVRLLYVLGNIYALGIKNAQLFKRIEEMARRDGLTGLLNHASFQQQLHELVDAADAAATPLTVIMSDIDHFKKFNDTHGHQAGDQVLREVSRLWKAVLPDYAVLGRYGGEEFVCALPQDDLERGRELAELLRESIAGHTVDFEGRELKVTSSFGVAEFGRPARTPQDLIKGADEALYEAKESGRNRVVCHQAAAAAVSADA